MEEPPPWDDAALDAQAAAMEIPGAAPVASAPAPKPKPKAAPAPKPAYTPPPKPDSRYPVLKGRAIGDKPVDIVELAEDSGIVVIEGTVTGVNEPKELKGGETVLVTFAVYDLTSTIYCKAFYQYRMKRRGMGEEPVPPTDEERAAGEGAGRPDQERDAGASAGRLPHGYRFWVNCPSACGICSRCPRWSAWTTARKSASSCTCTVTMSTMDATAEAGPAGGHRRPGGAILPWPLRITALRRPSRRPSARPRKTTLSSFPAWRAIWWIWCLSSRTRTTGSISSPIVVLDFETTGLSTVHDRIIEVGAVKLVDGQIVDELSFLCDPGVPLKPKITEITGISDLMLQGKESPAEGVTRLLAFIGDAAVAAHNASFDIGMLQRRMRAHGHFVPRAGAGYADLRPAAVPQSEELPAGRAVPSAGRVA